MGTKTRRGVSLLLLLTAAALVTASPALAGEPVDRILVGPVTVAADGTARIGTAVLAGDLVTLLAEAKGPVKVRVSDPGDGAPATLTGVFARSKVATAIFKDAKLASAKWSIANDAEVELQGSGTPVEDASGGLPRTAYAARFQGWVPHTGFVDGAVFSLATKDPVVAATPAPGIGTVIKDAIELGSLVRGVERAEAVRQAPGR
jgi:hypothetical protein